MRFNSLVKFHSLSQWSRSPLSRQFSVARSYQLAEAEKEGGEKKEEKKEEKKHHGLPTPLVMKLHPEKEYTAEETERLQKVYGKAVGGIYTRFDPEIFIKDVATRPTYHHPGFIIFFSLLALIALKRMYAKDELVDQDPMWGVRVEATHRFFGKTFEIANGDISNDNSMAVVVAMDDHFHHPTTKDGKLVFKKAGHDLEHFVHNYVEANGAPTGGEKVLLTPGTGNMSQRSALLASVPTWTGEKDYEVYNQKVARTVEAILLKAQHHDIRSISFSPFVDESSDIPAAVQIETVVSAIFQYCAQFRDTSVKRIRFVNSNPEYQQHMEQVFTDTNPAVPYDLTSWVAIFQQTLMRAKEMKAFKPLGQ